MQINFQVIKHAETRTVQCKCGDKTKRTKTFECTVNPFNKNPDGTVKSAAEVREQARAQAAEWVPDKYVCKACKGEGA